MRKKAFCYIIFAAFISAGFPALAQDFALQSLGAFHDTLWLANSDKDSAPSPILSVWGFSMRFGLMGALSVAPEIAFYEVEYLYRDGVAYPAEIEFADAVRTFNILLSIPFAYHFVPADDMVIHVGTGPAFSFKIPRRTYGDASGGDVAGYFLKKSRYLHWEAAASLEWRFYESLAIYIRTRILLPLYRQWDGDSLPFYDGMMAGVGFGLRLLF